MKQSTSLYAALLACNQPQLYLLTLPCFLPWPLPPFQLLPNLLAATQAAPGQRRDDASLLAVTVALPSKGVTSDDGGATSDIDRKSPVLLYLRGLLAWHRGRRVEGMGLLERSVQLLLESVEDMPLGLELFSALEAGRVLGVVRLLLDSLGADPRQSGEAPSPALSKAVRWVRGGVSLSGYMYVGRGVMQKGNEVAGKVAGVGMRGLRGLQA